MSTGSTSAARPPITERRRQAALLEMSEAAAELFVRRGVSATTVQDIADTAGVSARTFHRYFPSKADALGPTLSQGLLLYVQRVAEMPAGVPLVHGLRDALEESLAVGPAGHIEVLRLVVGTPELVPAWLRAHEECAAALAPVLAPHLPPGTDQITLRYTSASVVTANRLAVEAWLEQGGAPRPFLERCLDLLVHGVLPSP